MSTTNLPTQSSSEWQHVEQILQDFLEGKYLVPDIQEALGNYLDIHFDTGAPYREIANNSLDGILEIPVETQHLEQMLRRYIAGHISDVDLSDWAAFIRMSGVYVPTGNSEEERWQAAEGPVWDILQRLTSPTIFDGLNQLVAKEYLDMIAAYGV